MSTGGRSRLSVSESVERKSGFIYFNWHTIKANIYVTILFFLQIPSAILIGPAERLAISGLSVKTGQEDAPFDRSQFDYGAPYE